MPGLITASRTQAEKSLVVWQSLAKKCLPPAGNKNTEFWWNLTGYHLAVMIDAAGYSTQLQYETLLFHYHWIVPRLGPAPYPDGNPKFKSLIAYDGSPFEYSWKWNTTAGEPDIRYSWEAINSSSGTTADPLNHDPTLDYMEKVPVILPEVDFSWYRHFLAELYNPDRSVYAKEIEEGEPPATTLMHAVEYNRHASFGLKSKHPGRDALMHFLATSPEGQLMKPNVMGMDNVTPSKSRLKMYFTSRHTCFNSVREIITMGGLRHVSESSLQDLRSLILTILGLPADYPEEDEFTPTSAKSGDKWDDFDSLCEGFTYFFDIAPTSGVPDVKFYLPTRKYGADDLTIARNLVAWLRERGRDAYCNRYLDMLDKLAVHRGLENGKGMHAYISYQCTEKGEPDIKSYISPELYHKARYSAA
ncbi:aromatic prenyltransferase [Colletotrichum sublineola]|nr:aromatic prenyltransferase [Colletotrichum sublineola]